MKTHKCILDFGFLNALSEFEILCVSLLSTFWNLISNSLNIHEQRPYFVKNFVSIIEVDYCLETLFVVLPRKTWYFVKLAMNFYFFIFINWYFTYSRDHIYLN